MISLPQQSTRATIDVINFWCVAVLIISAVSVAGVVGAAVVTGEFESPTQNGTDVDTNTNVGVLTETGVDGSTTITWSDPGDAEFLEVRVDGSTADTLDFVGDESVIESGTYEVIAAYDDGSTSVVESRGT
jgi:hypothetical protein